MIRLAIFASGKGSNAINLMNYFAKHDKIQIGLIVSNNANCGAKEKATTKDIEFCLLSNEEAKNGIHICQLLQKKQIDYVVLAGYLKMIPIEMVKAYQSKIINIHPSLLPKFGGKGMYGAAVHKAVFENKETESGITIHFVNEEYDKGEIIAQKKVVLSGNYTPEFVEEKVRELELKWLPIIVEQVVLEKITA